MGRQDTTSTKPAVLLSTLRPVMCAEQSSSTHCRGQAAIAAAKYLTYLSRVHRGFCAIYQRAPLNRLHAYVYSAPANMEQQADLSWLALVIPLPLYVRRSAYV